MHTSAYARKQTQLQRRSIRLAVVLFILLAVLIYLLLRGSAYSSLQKLENEAAQKAFLSESNQYILDPDVEAYLMARTDDDFAGIGLASRDNLNSRREQEIIKNIRIYLGKTEDLLGRPRIPSNRERAKAYLKVHQQLLDKDRETIKGYFTVSQASDNTIALAEIHHRPFATEGEMFDRGSVEPLILQGLGYQVVSSN